MTSLRRWKIFQVVLWLKRTVSQVLQFVFASQLCRLHRFRLKVWQFIDLFLGLGAFAGVERFHHLWNLLLELVQVEVLAVQLVVQQLVAIRQLFLSLEVVAI